MLKLKDIQKLRNSIEMRDALIKALDMAETRLVALEQQRPQEVVGSRPFSDIKNDLRQELTSMVDATIAGGYGGPGSAVYRELQEIDGIVERMRSRLATLKKSHVLAALK
tara:strand:+ start:710 stop:1039 length:330 start_codon:yes stop_codon:yes gene_type:complete